MFNIFKKKRIVTSNSVDTTDKSPNLVINYWKSPGEYFTPFDDEIYNQQPNTDYGRLEFSMLCNHEYIPLGNIEVHNESGIFYITGVNTHEYCREKGVTNLLFSWLILKLMLVNKTNDFEIGIKIGINVKNIRNETGRFIYDKIFNENKNVKIASDNANRKFLLVERDEDYNYFKRLYEKVSESIINEYIVIKDSFEKFYRV